MRGRKTSWLGLMLAAALLAAAAGARHGAAAEPTADNRGKDGGGGGSPMQFSGVVTRAQLDSLEFSSEMDPRPKENQLVFPDVATAIHLNKPRYALDEAIPAWLMVRMTSEKEGRGLPATMRFGSTPAETLLGGSAAVRIYRERGGKLEAEALASWGEIAPPDGAGAGKVARIVGAGNAERTYVAANGYWVNRADLRSLARRGLEAGDYVVRFWIEGQRAEARFTVLAEKLAARPSTAPAATQPAEAWGSVGTGSLVLHLRGGWQGRRVVPAPGAVNGPANGPLWPMLVSYAVPRTMEDFATGLALGVGVGPETRYYAGFADVPAEDETVELRAEVVKDKAGAPEKIKVTLTPRNPKNRVGLAAFPSVYLLVEPQEKALAKAQQMALRNEPVWDQFGGELPFTQPVTLDITLNPGWTARCPVQGKVKLSVLVASSGVPIGIVRPGEYQFMAAQANMAQANMMNNRQDRVARVRGAALTSHWAGILRSGPVEIVLPKPEGAAGGGGPFGPPGMVEEQ